MPKIMADKKQLQTMSGELNKLHNKMKKITDDLLAVNKNLSWETKNKENIEKRIKSVHAEIEGQITCMAKLSNFLTTVTDQYDRCENSLRAEAGAFDGGSGEKIQNKDVVNRVLNYFDTTQGKVLQTILTPIAPGASLAISTAQVLSIEDDNKIYKKLYTNSYKKGLLEGNVDINAGTYAVESSSEAGWAKGETPKLNLSKSIQASGIEATADGKLGSDNAAIFAEANGSVLKANGDIGIEADLLEGRLGIGGEGKLAAVQGEVKGGFEVLGYKVGLKAEGDALSIGGEAKLEMDLLDKDKDGKVFEAGLGGSLGVGGSYGVVIEKA